MWTSIKNTTISTIIGAILYAMWGGLNLPVAPAQTVTYAAPVVQSAADKWWWDVFWWGGLIMGLLLVASVVVAVFRGNTSSKEPKGSRKEFDQWRLGKMFDSNQPQPATKTQEPEKPSVHYLSMVDAFNASSARRWVIGQAIERQPNRESSRQAVGQLLTVDYQTTNFAVLGGVGGGKTSSTGMMLIMYCKKYGLHPIVLDGKDGLDWGPLGDMGIVEWHTMTPDNLDGYIDQLNRIYKERHALMRQHGVGKIYDLPKSVRPQPLFVIMEEFGRTWARTNRDSGIENGFNDLFCWSRAAGIILCPIDQAPESWSKAMRANAKVAICYPAQGDALKAFGEHYIAELPQTGHFSRGNVFYRAWHTGNLYDLRKLSQIQRTYLTEPSMELRETGGSTVPPVTEPNPVVERNGTAGTLELELEPLVVVPPSVSRRFHGSTGNKWGQFCQSMFQFYPQMTMEQLQTAMANMAGGDAEAYKSRAFRGYHRFAPNGDRSRVKGYMEIAA